MVANPATTTSTICSAPPSPSTEFTFWVAQFRLLDQHSRRLEHTCLRRLQAALATAIDEEEDDEDKDDEDNEDDKDDEDKEDKDEEDEEDDE